MQSSELGVGESTTVQAVVRTDVLFPHELAVQIYHGVLDEAGEIHNGTVSPMAYKDDLGGGNYLFEGTLTLKQTGLHGYTVRALPNHEDLQSPHELGLGNMGLTVYLLSPWAARLCFCVAENCF